MDKTIKSLILRGHEAAQALTGSVLVLRPVKVQPGYGLSYMAVDGGALENGPDYPDCEDDFVPCPLGVPGEKRWVKEIWGKEWSRDAIGGTRTTTRYKADGCILQEGMEWQPPVHMPMWASRLTVKLKSVEVKRVQEISHTEAELTGVDHKMCSRAVSADCLGYEIGSIWQASFALDWNDRFKNWKSNPWCWFATFETEVK